MDAKLGEHERKPRVNFRVLLFAALGLVFGIFLYVRIRFGGLKASDFLFLLLFPLLSLRPVSLKRTAAVFLSLLVFAGVGVLSVHLYTQSYLAGKTYERCEVTATVNTFAVGEGQTRTILSHVAIDGERVRGKLLVLFPCEELRAGDEVRFLGSVSRSPEPRGSYAEYLFANNIRYVGSVEEYAVTGKSRNPFLLLNAGLYNVLHENMGKDEADVAYALLTGNSGGIDDGLITAVRKGGIAHIFAVSGLHIGILFSAVMLAGKRLGKYRFLPAAAVALCYCALCSFTVSSLRAVIMSTALGAYNALGRKHDLLNSVSFAAILVLLIFPAQFLAAGFRLSFGACVGLALYAGAFGRAFKKLPAFLGNYLAANLSVQIFTFPVLYETFGYFSVWGTLLNFVLIPLLPVLFLGVLGCSLLALVVPPAAVLFLAFPDGMLSLLVFVFTAADFSFVLTGFSLGAGGAVWLIAATGLSEKVRFSRKPRAVLAVGLAAVFALCVCVRNVVVTGCKITVNESGRAVLLQTGGERVLVIDGTGLNACEEFLNRNFGGTLSAVVVSGEDSLAGINTALCLKTEAIYAREEIPTGLQQTEIVFARSFSVGEMEFCFEAPSKLVVLCEDTVTEIDFDLSPATGADLFIGRQSRGNVFFLKDGRVSKILWQ